MCKATPLELFGLLAGCLFDCNLGAAVSFLGTSSRCVFRIAFFGPAIPRTSSRKKEIALCGVSAMACFFQRTPSQLLKGGADFVVYPEIVKINKAPRGLR